MTHDHEVGVFDAKANLSQLIERVEHGETVVITRHGVPVVRLVPYEAVDDQVKVGTAVQGLLAFRGPKLPRGVSLRKLIAEGRR